MKVNRKGNNRQTNLKSDANSKGADTNQRTANDDPPNSKGAQ
jgi:hypothetical protein